MALLSELVRIVSAVEGIDEVSVGIFARHAREAGFLSQGGRGRSAAKMTSRDAANLLIAVNGCALAKDVARSVPAYRVLVAKDRGRNSDFHICRTGALFGDDLEKVIEMFMARPTGFTLADIPPVVVRFRRPWIEAELSVYTVEDGVTEGQYAFYESSNASSSRTCGDRSDETKITTRTLKAVAEAL